MAETEQLRVLLIWELLPEDIKFFELINPTPEELAVLELANGKYVNASQGKAEAAASKISDALTLEAYDDVNNKWFEKAWHTREIKIKDLPRAGAFDRVYQSGFAL